MRVDLVRDEASTLPLPDRPEAVTPCRIWHCRYDSLDGVRLLNNMETPVVASWPDETLKSLSGLSNLRYLYVLHMPRITDLTPLGRLRALETLRLATPPERALVRQTNSGRVPGPTCRAARATASVTVRGGPGGWLPRSA